MWGNCVHVGDAVIWDARKRILVLVHVVSQESPEAVVRGEGLKMGRIAGLILVAAPDEMVGGGDAGSGLPDMNRNKDVLRFVPVGCVGNDAADGKGQRQDLKLGHGQALDAADDEREHEVRDLEDGEQLSKRIRLALVSDPGFGNFWVLE